MSSPARKIDIPEEIESTKTTKARPIEIKEKDLSRFRSLVSAPLKGLLKELPSIAKMADPVAMFLGNGPLERFYESKVEETLPTQDEFAEQALERGGRIAPYAIAGEGGIAQGLLRSGLSALGGQAAEEMGAGPIGQAVAEMSAFSAPSMAKKIIPSNKEQKAILDLAKKHGLTENQIAPLMPENLKRKAFGKFASKGESTIQQMKETRQGIADIYGALKSSTSAKNILGVNETNQFSKEMNKIGMNMPHALRSQLRQDAQDLVNSARKKGGISGDDLMNFYHDVSSRYNLGRSQLELFKDPIKKAMHSIDPQLGKDFEVANQMWKRQSKMGETLYPGKYEELISLGETAAAAAAAAKGDVGMLVKVLGVTGARKLSKAMLTNPRLQNIIKKTESAIKQNNIPMIKKLGDLIVEEYKSEEE